jgi:hypothetical protein
VLDGTGAVLTGAAALVSALLLGAPSGVKAYVDLATFRDKRREAKRQPREISTVSPATGTITKRSA